MRYLVLLAIVIVMIVIWRVTSLQAQQRKTEAAHASSGQLLCKAVLRNDLPKVRTLLAKGAEVEVWWNGRTPLMFAASRRSFDMIQLLLNHGAKVNSRSRDEADTIPLLIALAPDPEDGDPMPYKDEANRVKIAELLLAKGAKPNVQNKIYQAPLMLATGGHSIKIVQLLIKRGANQNTITGTGMSLFEIAAAFGDEATVRMMLKRNPSKEQRLKAIGYAYNNPKIGPLIWQTFTNPSERRAALTEVLFGTVYEDKSLPLTKRLVEAGADINAQDDVTLRTPLMMATESGAFETIHFLVVHGADISLKNHRGNTALSIAKIKLEGAYPKDRKKWEQIIPLLTPPPGK